MKKNKNKQFKSKIKNLINDVNMIKLIIFIVLFCTYIFPLYIVDPTYVVSKAIFLAAIMLSYFFFYKKLQKYDYVLIAIILFLFVVTKSFNYLTFLSLPIANIFLNYKNEIINYVKKSPVIYICLAFTILYSIIFFGYDGRYAFTAIKEINQSGLAIFFLGIMLLYRKKIIGIIFFLFGLLTFSRSYYLALILLFIFKNRFIKIKLSDKLIKILNYSTIVVVTTICFIGLAFLYISKFKNGDIGANSNLYKFINPFDYSNLFRFAALLYTVNIFICHPNKIFLGLTQKEYDKFSSQLANKYGVVFRETDPHNLFFSHLKMYGFMTFIETIYITKILMKIVNNKNFFLYVAIVAYSVILGAGLYSYWLFLAIISLIVFSKYVEECELNND